MKKEAFEEIMSLLFLQGAEPRRYGSIQKDLASAFTRNRDEYPTTMRNTMDILETQDQQMREFKHVDRSEKKESKKDRKDKKEAKRRPHWDKNTKDR